MGVRARVVPHNLTIFCGEGAVVSHPELCSLEWFEGFWRNMCRKLPYLMATVQLPGFPIDFPSPAQRKLGWFPQQPSHRPSFSIWYDGLSASQSFLSTSRKQSRGSWTSSPGLGKRILKFWGPINFRAKSTLPNQKCVALNFYHWHPKNPPIKSPKKRKKMGRGCPGDSKRWNSKEYLEPRALRGSSMAQLQSLQASAEAGRVRSSASASMPMMIQPIQPLMFGRSWCLRGLLRHRKTWNHRIQTCGRAEGLLTGSRAHKASRYYPGVISKQMCTCNPRLCTIQEWMKHPQSSLMIFPARKTHG